jgi:hypothetical protein
LRDVINKIVNGHANSRIGDLLPWALLMPKANGLDSERDERANSINAVA